jgi:hypothetical protein
MEDGDTYSMTETGLPLPPLLVVDSDEQMIEAGLQLPPLQTMVSGPAPPPVPAATATETWGLKIMTPALRTKIVAMPPVQQREFVGRLRRMNSFDLLWENTMAFDHQLASGPALLPVPAVTATETWGLKTMTPALHKKIVAMPPVQQKDYVYRLRQMNSFDLSRENNLVANYQLASDMGLTKAAGFFGTTAMKRKGGKGKGRKAKKRKRRRRMMKTSGQLQTTRKAVTGAGMVGMETKGVRGARLRPDPLQVAIRCRRRRGESLQRQSGQKQRRRCYWMHRGWERSGKRSWICGGDWRR